MYLIPKSFHLLLKRIDRVRRVRLGEFWSGFWRRYGHAVLEQSQVEWIVKAKNEGVLKNEDIANAQGISVSRVQQLYRAYRKSGTTIPVLKRAGRPSSPDITKDERDIVKQAFERFRMCACYLEKIIQFHYGVKINHRRIHRILREEGLAVSEPRKQRRRKWIRYEREGAQQLAVAYRLASDQGSQMEGAVAYRV